jgi:hypothetical protein
MFWMTDIAAQLAFLAAAQVNGISTNVGVEVGESATPEAIINVVVLGYGKYSKRRLNFSLLNPCL